MNRIKKYINAVESLEYEKNAWHNFHNGNIKIWNKWAARLRFVATVLKPYLKKKEAV
tara:strand:- start:1210 stop:1380 length:171 start_codon:yes stop_codon:yes gene_type:complete